jgi:hypothetical protein
VLLLKTDREKGPYGNTDQQENFDGEDELEYQAFSDFPNAWE